ncbi:MAG: class I adenylate-forming enzyme family protein, partial [Desulfotomaculales bacterium]
LGSFPDLEKFNRNSIVCLMIGAAPSPFKLFEEINRVFPKAEVIHCYGLTESAATASYLPSKDFLRKPGSVGKGYLNTEIRIINEQGEDVPVNEVGEIVVRGPNVMKGYYQDPRATEEAFFCGEWLRTGDLGRFDEDGYLYIVDRSKDMIISGGENVYSQEVENVLCANEKIAEAAVIGVPDEVYGEVVKAVVVPKPGVKITEQEVIDFCRERLAGFKRPRSVVFVESLPKSSANKVMKRVLREKYVR